MQDFSDSNEPNEENSDMINNVSKYEVVRCNLG